MGHFCGKRWVATLNLFCWTDNGGEWKSENINGETTYWLHDDYDTEYPTVFPERPFTVKIFENSEFLREVKFEEAFGEDSLEKVHLGPNGDFEVIYKKFSLQELSEYFTKSILDGWIEIACTANKSNYYVYFESIRIYANGKAIRKKLVSGFGESDPIEETEIFEPN